MKFLKDVIKEMKQVTWPTGKEVNRYTITVLFTVILAVIFFATVDTGLAEGFKWLLQK